MKNNIKDMTITEKPTVSVIMGVHNCNNLSGLKQSVQSICNQTYRDWEFIIVDDGSKDGGVTFSAIGELAATDDRIIALRYEDNKGLSYALNYCLKFAQGEYIARQDDDDLSIPTRLEKQVAFLDYHPEIDIVGTEALLFDADGEWGKLKLPSRPSSQDFLWNSPFIHPSVVIRAESLRSVGGYRVAPETMRGQDYDLFMRMYSCGMRGANLKEELYLYRSDRATMKYLPMKYRINEAKIRYNGFKKMRLGIGSYPFVVKPILLGLMPKCVYGCIQGKRMSK